MNTNDGQAAISRHRERKMQEAKNKFAANVLRAAAAELKQSEATTGFHKIAFDEGILSACRQLLFMAETLEKES